MERYFEYYRCQVLDCVKSAQQNEVDLNKKIIIMSKKILNVDNISGEASFEELVMPISLKLFE